MDEVFAHRMAPVLAGILRRVGLVEEVPPALPPTQPVGVVQRPLRVDVVVDGAVPMTRQEGTRSGQPFHHRMGLQHCFLLGKRVGKRVEWNLGWVVGHSGLQLSGGVESPSLLFVR